ncbi:MAG: response regulator transcription factor [Candidatus Tyrphobacter sp.]
MTRIESLLSDAERDVLALLLDGLTNVQIAREIERSDKTVKNHISHILTKTGCATRLELTVRVYKAREKELKRRLRAA